MLTGYQSEIHRPKRDIAHISSTEKPIHYRRRRRKRYNKSSNANDEYLPQESNSN